jgi:hypothetical protein
MSNWKSYLKKNTLEWLLEDSNPSVKYFALTDLLDKKTNLSEVMTAKSKIMTEGVVPKILNKQSPEGYWGDPLSFYLPKRKATVWQFYTLVDFAADRNDERIMKVCEYLLKNSQHKESGAFSHHSYERLRLISTKDPKPSERVLLKNLGPFSDGLYGGSSVVLPCLTGQMLFSLIRCGFLEDPRVHKCIDWIVKFQRFDDGETKPQKEWPYILPILHYGDSCWGKHTCHTGVVGVLTALSEIPKSKRSKEVRRVLGLASEHMLKHHIYKRSHNLNQISIQDWMNLGYPHLDFLTVLSILSKLGHKDERMQDAVDLLLSKQNKNGRWLAEKPGYEQKGKESKWITLNALRCLKNYYS